MGSSLSLHTRSSAGSRRGVRPRGWGEDVQRRRLSQGSRLAWPGRSRFGRCIGDSLDSLQFVVEVDADGLGAGVAADAAAEDGGDLGSSVGSSGSRAPCMAAETRCKIFH